MKSKNIINYLKKECPFFKITKGETNGYFTVSDDTDLYLECCIFNNKKNIIYIDNVGTFNLLHLKIFLIMIYKLRSDYK
jgi:hypothetical protein